MGDSAVQNPLVDLEAPDDRIELDEFMSILQEEPLQSYDLQENPIAVPQYNFFENQVKPLPRENGDDHQSNNYVPLVGLVHLESLNHTYSQQHNEASLNSQLPKDADMQKFYGLQGAGESSLSELLDASVSDCLNLSAGDSSQPDDQCGSAGSSQSDLYEDYLDELIPFADSERPQQTSGSDLTPDWISLSISDNNNLIDVPSLNPSNTAREAKMFGGINGSSYSQNLKLNPNNIDKSVPERSCQVPATRELVDLTQTDSDDEIEIRTEQFGNNFGYNGDNADAFRKHHSWGQNGNNVDVRKLPSWCQNGDNVDVRKLPPWGQTSGKSLMKKESKEPSWRNSTLTDTSDWNSRKPPINAQERRVLGIQSQGVSGAAVGHGIFKEKNSVTGNSYQHGDFKFEQVHQVKEEWTSGVSFSNWKSGPVNLEMEANEKPTSYLNDDSDTEIPDNNVRRHLPPNLAPGIPWTKTEDERQAYKAALQDLAQPTLEASPDDGLLAVSLLRHQRIALAWMVQKETSNIHCAGGILADDQGLGKTVSTIALILKERPAYQFLQEDTSKVKLETSAVNLDEDDVTAKDFERNSTNNSSNDLTSKESTHPVKKGRPSAGTLVVCPTSVLRQWAQEIQDKVTTKANVSVLVYHGSNRTKDPNELAKYDIVLTTYSIVSLEVPKPELGDDHEESERNRDDCGLIDAFTDKKKKKKNNSETAKKKNRKGGSDSSSELIPRPLAKVGWFRVVLDEAQSIKNHRTQVARACWGLRAKRRWCLSGTPIQNSIDDLYSYFRFLKYDPFAIYRSFCSEIKMPISRNPSAGYKKLQLVLKKIMLRRTKCTFIDGEPIINLPPKTVTLKKIEFSLEEREFYQKLEIDSQARFKVYQDAGTVKQNYVNILLMLLRLRQACDHPLLVKACSSDTTWRSSAEIAKKLPSEKLSELINSLEGSLAICGICNDAPEVAVVTLCGHVFCNQCILTHLTQPDEAICPSPNCKCQLKADSVFSLATLQNTIQKRVLGDQITDGTLECSSDESVTDSQDMEITSSKIKVVLDTLQALQRVRTGVPWSPSVNNMDKDAGYQGSMPDDILHENASELSEEINPDMQPSQKKRIIEAPEKAIVFSQWTSMLDLLEGQLKKSCIQYRRLDGTMSVLARDKAVNDFKTSPEVTVMIMSLKAASLGLNMVAACHVLLLDLWWNPTTEDQAIDRAHRIGQTRPVQVSRFTVKDTVEDRILALQERKRLMVASAFGEDESGGRQSHLTEEDLRYLFMT
ncbi:hypothetical protein SUGI_0733660 [Cryptomeria japonica]|uniref:helicase-like transcription factor CHR28 isoform X2 n=1 Tax=Cryptomeria japonica TaxID=3369 RepID=UPI002414B11A|nr:helicase-like transcription factor CHR28 isoform X2 [Cryptomeria japonica]GLJ36518.1 hypothetical protein SUGI_0733660 [Cryptomeria japonica]